jgi:CelD/BcsL family acetyltransferase involved in cellulose biosynthesis
MDGVERPAQAGRLEFVRAPAGVEGPPTLSGEPAVAVMRSFEDLVPLAARWEELQHHPWSDHAFFHAITSREPGFVRPHVLAVREPGRAPGLVVASLQEEQLAWKVGGLALLRARARVLRVPTGGLLALAGAARAQAAAESLRASLAAGEADAVYVHEAAAEEPLVRELLHPRDALADPAPRRTSGWVLPLPGSFAEFRRLLPGKARSNLNHAANVAHRALGGEPELRCFTKPDELEELVQHSERVASTTYHRRAGFGFVDSPAARRLLAHALARGWLRAHVLFTDGRPIAFEHGLAYRGTYYGRHTGFDPAFAAARPGVYLLLRVLERLCDERVATRLDLGVMDTQLKRTLGGLAEERISLYLFAPGVRGRWLATSRAAVGGLERAARAVLGGRLARRLRRAWPAAR